MSNTRSNVGFRMAVLSMGFVILGVNLFAINYEQLLAAPLAKENLTDGFRILSCIIIITAMLLSLRHTAEKEEK